MKIVWKAEKLEGLDSIQIRNFNRNQELLYRIQNMPKKVPLSLVKARNFVCEMPKQDQDVFPSGEFKEVLSDWVAWISKQGFHIELKGDEYEILPSDATH